MRAIVDGADHAREFLAARGGASINGYGRARRADIHARASKRNRRDRT
jgi:hypothetical protein